MRATAPPPHDVRAFDVLTGKLVWTFHTIPYPGEYGDNTWPEGAYKWAGGVNTRWQMMSWQATRLVPSDKVIPGGPA